MGSIEFFLIFSFIVSSSEESSLSFSPSSSIGDIFFTPIFLFLKLFFGLLVDSELLLLFCDGEYNLGGLLTLQLTLLPISVIIKSAVSVWIDFPSLIRPSMELLTAVNKFSSTLLLLVGSVFSIIIFVPPEFFLVLLFSAAGFLDDVDVFCKYLLYTNFVRFSKSIFSNTNLFIANSSISSSSSSFG